MKTTSLQIKFGLALTVTFITGCFGHVSERANSDSRASMLESETGQTAEPTERAPGIIVHIDPKTGEIITPPAGALPGPVAQPQPPVGAAKKPLAELRETLSPVPGGGFMIYLDERFHTPLSATIDTDGKVRFEHKQTGSDDKN
jgi:hypothetical protein